MLKSLVLTAFRRAGYQVVKRPRETYQLHSNFNKAAFEETVERVRQISAAHDPSGSLWQMAKKYMTARRTSFYYEVLEVMEQAGVVLDGRTVLDVGAFFGSMLYVMHEHHPQGKYHGIELSDRALRIATELCPFATFRQCPMEELDVNEKYDVILLEEVLEHIAKPEQALQSLWPRTKDSLVITVPNGRYDCHPAREYIEAGGCYRGHVNFWSPESWPNWIEQQVPNCRLRTGELPSSQLYAILQRSDAAECSAS
ncbi:MAG: class I SAM-dependent methyltransferase [Pirellulales bacterium]